MKTSGKTRKTRPYKSDVRAAHAELTRGRILDAAVAVFRTDPERVTMRDVAARAAIAVPTVYRHFETLDALVAAVEADANKRLFTGIAIEQLADRALYPEFLRRFFANFEALGPEVQALSVTRRARARRRARRPARMAQVAQAFARELAALEEPERTYLGDWLAVVLTTASVRAFSDYLELDAAAAADRVLWLIDVLGRYALGASAGRKKR